MSITAGCGHAMTVSETGGVCECPICGARCDGRFDACESILRRPGYIPAFAPAWAVEIPDASSSSWDTSRTDPNGVPAIAWHAANGATPRNGSSNGSA